MPVVTDPGLLAELNGTSSTKKVVTDPALLAQLNGGSAAVPPSGLVPGSREYADWAAAQARAGKTLPQVSPPPPTGPQPSLGDKVYNSVVATANGLTSAVPFLQQGTDALMGLGSMATGGDYGKTVQGLQDRRAQIAQAAPIARTAGEIGGTIGTFGAAAIPKLGAEAMGLTGPLLQQIGKSMGSTAAYSGLQSLANGKQGGQVLADMGLGGLGGVAGPIVGRGLEKTGESIANAMTSGAQRRATSGAIAQGAPTGGQLKSAASQMFESSTDGKPLMISDTSYFRFLGDVKQVADKFRINPENDKQSVGLLGTLMRIADDTASGTRVDMKDLHLVRQLAGKVAQSSEGRDSAFGSQVVGKLDDFIKTLKPSDILGGANPNDAAKQLMTELDVEPSIQGLDAENAIEMAKTYKSGFENGLRLQFLGLLKDAQFRNKLTKPELQAINDVAHGTGKSNLITLLGKFGFGLNGAGNMTGGTAGALLGTGIGSMFGPVGAVAGTGAAMAGGAAMRKLSEQMAERAAQRAAQTAATQGVPVAAQSPNLLSGVGTPLEMLLRGATVAGQN